MGRQISFCDVEFNNKRRKTQKEVFFEKMRQIVPLDEWCDLIRPYYFNNSVGRQPIELEIMLKMYLVSQWFNLSDPATEDILNENLSARTYVGVVGDAPDETTLCKFRQLLEKHNLIQKIFDSFNERLVQERVILKEGTLIDATIIEAPQSRKNKTRQRTPGMGSTTKNGRRYFGLKAHIGVDEDSGIVHSMAITPANVSDIEMAASLVHGEETRVNGDAGYTGIEYRADIREKFQDGTGETEWLTHSHKKAPYMVCKLRKGVEFAISRKRSKVITPEMKEEERQKSRVRARVEHAFGVIKARFGYRRTRYRGLQKNANNLLMLITLANVLTYSRIKLSTK